MNKAISEWWVAKKLQGYDVRPQLMRMGQEQGRGYLLEDFKEIFGRYVGPNEVEGLS